MKRDVKFNLVARTREEWESSRSDANRFELPNDYMEKDSLHFFREDFNRRLFVEFYYNSQMLSNDSMLRLAEVSSPFVNLDRKVVKPLFQVYEMFREKYVRLAKREYDVDEVVACRLLHLCMTVLVTKVKLHQLNSSTDFNKDLNHLFREKCLKHE